ncbi:DUF2087 domain-containing protein [Streptomyces sp. NPDC008150]|uniref:DUF2087 domain-containing protein n=1 Tax=Streptomyces sp. NPDC008150 TaxID=3364816 RepID=UPI0036E5A2FA
MPTDEPEKAATAEPAIAPTAERSTGPAAPAADRAGSHLVRLFAEESRVRAFAAVVLGAQRPGEVASAAGLTARETAAALRRLTDSGAVVAGRYGQLGVDYGHLRDAARAAVTAAERADAGDGGAAEGGEGDDGPTEMILRTFVRDGRLVRLPARWTRKKIVLRHIAERTFEPDVEYPERMVNDKLRAWCEDGEVDHVTLRRYLVDLAHLRRSDGVYVRTADPAGTD